MEIDYEKLFKISLIAMKISRSHPDIPRDKKWFLEAGIMYAAYTITCCVLIYSLIVAIDAGNYTEACTHAILCVVYFYISIAYVILVINRESITKLAKLMMEDYKKDLSRDEKMIVLDYAKKGSNVCTQWLFVTLITGGAYPFKHIVMEIYLYITGEFELLMLYPLTFPSPIEEIKMHPFIYTVAYATMMYYAIYSSLTYISFTPLGPAFMLHACGQLEIIKIRASQLFTDTEEEKVKVKMVKIVKHLQYVYDFVEDVNGIFRLLYELTLRGSSVMLSVTLFGFLWSLSSGVLSMELLNFLYAGTLISSSPCYYSDMLMEKGEDARFAIYSCGWEKVYNHGARKTMLIVLQRALQPTCIRTMFRIVCLDALTDMFQQAYALFNLMNVAWG